MNRGGKILVSLEGYSYIDTIFLYTSKDDTNDEWVIEKLDTKWDEFREGAGIFSIQFWGDTYRSFIVDEIIWEPAKINRFTSLSVNAWQSTIYEEKFEIRVTLGIKDSIYENGNIYKIKFNSI